MAAGREREVIGLDQHAVGGGAVEHLLSRLHRQRPVHVESGCHSGWRANRYGLRTASLITSIDCRPEAIANARVPRRVAERRDRDDAGRDLGAGLEPAHLLGDVAENAPGVAEIDLDAVGRPVHLGVVHPVGPFRLRHQDFGIGENLVAVLGLEAVDMVGMEMRDDDGVDRRGLRRRRRRGWPS